jgi:hypothetical protein
MDIFTPVLKALKSSTEADVRLLSLETGVPKPTIDKIKFGQTPNPRVLTIQPLYAAMFEGSAAAREPSPRRQRAAVVGPGPQ